LLITKSLSTLINTNVNNKINNKFQKLSTIQKKNTFKGHPVIFLYFWGVLIEPIPFHQ
jgi:hypothetical protein